MASTPSATGRASGTPTDSSTPSSPSPTSSNSSLPSSSSSSSTGPTVHTVTVGAGSFKYEPDSIKADVGDTVSFEFYPPDHSVARAEYLNPCVPYEYTGRGKQGFWSETQWVNDTSEITHWNLTVNSTEPIFFYCAAPNSCIGKLMVGVINPNATQTLDAQIKAAGKAQLALAPGDPVPNEATSSLPNAPTASTGSSGNSNNNNTNNTQSHALSGGVIAGIVVGAVAFLVICAALFFYVGRTKSLKEVMKSRDAAVPPTPGHRDGYPGSSGFGGPNSPFSPNMHQAEYGQLPVYGQHQVADSHPTGWGHSPHALEPAQLLAEAKQGYNIRFAELPSPPIEQQGFTAELEASGGKSQR